MNIPNLRLSVVSVLAFAAAFAFDCPAFAAPQVGSKAVISKNGYPLKGITKTHTALFDTADPESAKQRPYKAFQFVYILPPDPDGPRRYTTLIKDGMEGLEVNGMYRVGISQHGGNSSSSEAGFLLAEDVQLWGHIQSLHFTPSENRDLAFFFETTHEMEEYYAGGEGKVLAVAAEPEDKGNNLIIMPVLGPEETVELGEEEMTRYKCAFMAGIPSSGASSAYEAGGGTTASETLTLEEAREALGVDVVFVIDTTSSMAPAFESVRSAVKGVAESLKEADLPPLRLGLVGFRDKGDEYVSKVFCNLGQGESIELFLSRVAGLEAEGGGDPKEDVFAGLRMALNSEAMGWAVGPEHWNIIVLIGDAPGHRLESSSNTTKSNEKTILQMAQPENPAAGTRAPVHFYVQHLETSMSEEDLSVISEGKKEELRVILEEWHADGREQFLALSESARYSGHYRKSLKSDDFSDVLSGEMLMWMENMGDMLSSPVSVIEAGASVSKAKMKPSHQIEWLRKVATEASRNETQKVKFGEAYVAEIGRDGSRLFVPHVFVERSQLETYAQTLQWLGGLLERAGKPGSKDVKSLVKDVAGFTATINLGESFTTHKTLEGMELTKLLMAMSGLPSQTNIFSVTLPELAQMAPSDWDDWLGEMEEKIRNLHTLLDTPSIWWPLDDASKESDYHAFIKLSDLP